MNRGDRQLVFISHANPEDNEFTLWLATRLTALGYLVWSDLTKLFGAEIFWNDIEDAIRNHASKVIVVLSNNIQHKDGALDEINLAVSIERSQNIERFVIPVRIDTLPFSDVKPNLARKNIIDFYGKWIDGFRQLIKVLERDSVAKARTLTTSQTSNWIENVLAGSMMVLPEPQALLSNWISFLLLPHTLHFLRVPIPKEQLKNRFQDFDYPWFPYQDMIATFANENDVNRFLPSWHKALLAYRIPVSVILDSQPHSMAKLERREAVNMLSYLVRTAWDSTMRSKGLHSYAMASGRYAWYPIKGYSPDNWIKYLDMSATQRRKRLIGQSTRHQVHWHFAMEALPSISKISIMTLRPHVVFTKDGLTPIYDYKEMHRLRRGFCKNWWNSRWRDLMLAYCRLITTDCGSLTLQMSSEQHILIDARPVIFQAPVSIGNLTKQSLVEDETDSQLDAIAEEQDYESEDDLEDDNVDHEVVEEEGTL
jgi:hypothetical protein